MKIFVFYKVNCGEEEFLAVSMFVDDFMEMGDSCLFDCIIICFEVST